MTPAEFKKIRLGLKYSQSQLAKVIGQSPNTVARKERGQTPIGQTTEILMNLLWKGEI